MKEIIGDNGHVFDKNQRPTRQMGNIRHQIYHDAYNKYGGPTIIQKYLKETYNFSVNQSTIYYAWYKIKERNKEQTASQFIESRFGNGAYTQDKNIELLMIEYASYQLSLHVENEYKNRFDIKNKIVELNNYLDGNGYR